MTIEHVVYNIRTGDAVTVPMPREMAESICEISNDFFTSPRYTIRPVAGFDYDALIETALQDDAAQFAQCKCGCGDGNEYDRQWAFPLHALAYRVLGVWFVVFNVVGVVALWAR